MPFYTYQCEECGVRFDAKQRFTDDPINECPECGGATHKVIGPVGVVFKGSGFYVTDSRSNRANLTAPTKKDGGESNGSDTKSEAKSDTKSETTSTTKSENKSSNKSGSDS